MGLKYAPRWSFVVARWPNVYFRSRNGPNHCSADNQLLGWIIPDKKMKEEVVRELPPSTSRTWRFPTITSKIKWAFFCIIAVSVWSHREHFGPCIARSGICNSFLSTVSEALLVCLNSELLNTWISRFQSAPAKSLLPFIPTPTFGRFQFQFQASSNKPARNATDTATRLDLDPLPARRFPTSSQYRAFKKKMANWSCRIADKDKQDHATVPRISNRTT